MIKQGKQKSALKPEAKEVLANALFRLRSDAGTNSNPDEEWRSSAAEVRKEYRIIADLLLKLLEEQGLRVIAWSDKVVMKALTRIITRPAAPAYNPVDEFDASE